MSISLLDKLKNKALYRVEKLVNDPEANRYMEEVKKEKEKEKEKEKPDSSPPVKEALEQPEEPESSSAVVRIFRKGIHYTKRILEVAFFPFLALVLSSFVANEMILYPAPIRLVFFFFTLGVCLLSRMVLTLLGVFYLCKWGFHYYINEMSDGPKRLIMPTLFALLPLTTNEYPNRFKNFFAKPFQYGERWSRRDGRELETRMEMYQTSLKESFPFIEALQNQEPYQGQLQKIETSFRELHQAMAPSAPTTSAPPPTTPPLPPVLSPVPSAPPSSEPTAPAPPLPPVLSPAPPEPTAPAPPSEPTSPPSPEPTPSAEPTAPPPAYNNVTGTTEPQPASVPASPAPPSGFVSATPTIPPPPPAPIQEA